MTSAAPYLIRQQRSVTDTEPQPLSETDALKILVRATAGAACPFHEVGPVAAHLAGPIAAIPPEGHPAWSSLSSQRSRGSSEVNALITDACALQTDVRCNGMCEGIEHHLLATVRHLSRGKIARAHVGSTGAQERVAAAINSGDIDVLIYTVEPRLEALKMISDRARAEHGGNLPEPVIEAVVALVRTLAGPTRWDVRAGYCMWEWPQGWRWTALANTCNSMMVKDFIHDAVMRRLIEGN